MFHEIIHVFILVIITTRMNIITEMFRAKRLCTFTFNRHECNNFFAFRILTILFHADENRIFPGQFFNIDFVDYCK
jgi:hypothetical protein